jgi:hypothetical protein
MGAWERLRNPDFNVAEFGDVKMESVENCFIPTTKQWTERTNAIGIIAKPGRYGGTYANRLDEIHGEKSGGHVYLEKAFRAFYAATKPPEIAELYETYSIRDLFSFEFVEMIERDTFIKKCKN